MSWRKTPGHVPVLYYAGTMIPNVNLVGNLFTAVVKAMAISSEHTLHASSAVLLEVQ